MERERVRVRAVRSGGYATFCRREVLGRINRVAMHRVQLGIGEKPRGEDKLNLLIAGKLSAARMEPSNVTYEFEPALELVGDVGDSVHEDAALSCGATGQYT